MRAQQEWTMTARLHACVCEVHRPVNRECQPERMAGAHGCMVHLHCWSRSQLQARHNLGSSASAVLKGGIAA